ncbi:hypothetical protein L6V77_32685 [Myxococcota bacterium]|jgi:hypothetical protein|nr:hypothetical protein [Myxococcota bacterium]
MSDQTTPRSPATEPAVSPAPVARRPYVKPGFVTSAAFERQALSCAGCLNLAPAPPALCSMRS